MIPRLVPEISPLDAFCDERAGAAGAVGIGDSRSWMSYAFTFGHLQLLEAVLKHLDPPPKLLTLLLGHLDGASDGGHDDANDGVDHYG